MTFYQKHHWDREKAALGFGPDWIKTLVSTATDNSHRVIMEKKCCHLFSAVLDRIHFILAGNNNIHKSFDEFEIWPDPTSGSHGNR